MRYILTEIELSSYLDLKGHGFSRAVNSPKKGGALAPEGEWLSVSKSKNHPSAAKAAPEFVVDGTAQAAPLQSNVSSTFSWKTLSNRFLAAAAFAAVLLTSGCRMDMQDEPKFVPQRGTKFFADGRSVRPQVEHTVARGQLREDAYFNTGLMNGKEQNMMPFPVTMQVLERGQERYNIYCTPCHSRVGNGAGMIVQRGYKPAGNYHDARRMAQPLSHYFYVMSNGYGAMPNYAAQLTPADRWAVAAYIRALQLSQAATVADVPQGTQVENLSDIAVRSGYPVSFAGPWPEPATAVQSMPTGPETAGAPAQNSNPPDSKNRPLRNPTAVSGETMQPR